MVESGVKVLAVYNRSMDLVVEVYRLTGLLPQAERFGLVPQMQRAATSIPMNISEGYGRKHRGDYVRSLSIARGSLFELDTQVDIATRLEFLDEAATRRVTSEIDALKRMLSRLIIRLSE